MADFKKILKQLLPEADSNYKEKKTDNGRYGTDYEIIWTEDGEDMEVTLNVIGTRFGKVWRIKHIPSVPNDEYSLLEGWDSKEKALAQAKKLIAKFYK